MLHRVIPKREIDRSRKYLNAGSSRASTRPIRTSSTDSTIDPAATTQPTQPRRSDSCCNGFALPGVGDAAGYTVSDVSLLQGVGDRRRRRQAPGGADTKGRLAGPVPHRPRSASSLYMVISGPSLTIISFVCSVGNVPLAAALCEGSSSFAG